MDGMLSRSAVATFDVAIRLLTQDRLLLYGRILVRGVASRARGSLIELPDARSTAIHQECVARAYLGVELRNADERAIGTRDPEHDHALVAEPQLAKGLAGDPVVGLDGDLHYGVGLR